jgi:hypothetical protein
MASNFSFGFSGDDIDNEQDDDEMRIDVPQNSISTGLQRELLPPQKHNLEEIVRLFM